MHVAELPQKDQLCATLKQLLAADVLAQAPRQTGERLLRRLSSDIRVVLLGPEAEGKSYLEQRLAALNLPRTALRNVGTETDFDFSQGEVCLWCTAEFGGDELALWQGAPDRLKDHSFLVPMATPETAAEQLSPARLDALGDVAAEEFFGLYPVVLPADPSAPCAAAEALMREVAQIVQRGDMADLDNVQMFLQMHQEAVGDLPPAPIEEVCKTPAPPPEPQAPTPQMTPPAPRPVERTERDDATSEALNQALQQALGKVRDNVVALEPLMTAGDEEELREIMAICERASAEVADVFADSPARAPAFITLRDEMQSAADKVLLMSLEGGVAPAIAAVTTVLQMRREIEVQIAC